MHVLHVYTPSLNYDLSRGSVLSSKQVRAGSTEAFLGFLLSLSKQVKMEAVTDSNHPSAVRVLQRAAKAGIVSSTYPNPPPKSVAPLPCLVSLGWSMVTPLRPGSLEDLQAEASSEQGSKP